MPRNRLEEGSFWDRFLDMFAESIIIQSLVTALLILTLCYLWIYSAINQGVVEVPPELLQITMIVLGFWFGQKTVITGKRSAEDIAYAITHTHTGGEHGEGTEGVV